MHSSTTSRQVEAIGSCLSTILPGTTGISANIDEITTSFQRYLSILMLESSHHLSQSIAARIVDSGKPVSWWLEHFPELFI